MTKRKKYPGMLLYFDRIAGLVDGLPDAELGRIFRAMYHYSRYGTEPDSLPAELRFFWPMLTEMLDEDKESYYDKCRTNALSAATRAAKDRGEPPPDKEEFFRQYDAARKQEEFENLPYDQQESRLRDEAMRKLEDYCNSQKSYN